MNLRDSRNGSKNTNTNSYESQPTIFLKRLQQNLEDLSEELELTNAKNAELNRLANIMTEERNYYCQELKKSQSIRSGLEQQLRKEKLEADSKNLLVNQLKKANRHLIQQVQQLNENLEESKFMFNAQQQQIERIRKEKQLIETQWNRVIRQVHLKMTKLQLKNQEEEKENIEMFANLPLKEKVKKALQKIDREIQENQQSSAPKNRSINQWRLNLKQSSTNSSTNEFLDEDSTSYDHMH